MPYSVLTEPIIPVLMPEGEEKFLGLREVFLEAHHIRDISGAGPLERYAVLRLLIAFAMDMLHPKTCYDRLDLFEAGRFDAKVFDGYIEECQKSGQVFDLFDPDRPFMQSKYDAALDAKAKKPVALMLHALPSGNNHVFIDHRLADSHEIDIRAAFGALCASYVFCVSGLAGPSGVNNTPPLFAIVLGKNLFETIVFNMVSVAEAAPLPYGEGEVPWRKNRKIIPREPVASVSLLEGLTWMPRRITLIKEKESNSIKNIFYQAGLDFRGNDLWNDPHVPCFRKRDNTLGTVKPELGREVWRHAGTLLYDHDSRRIRQPLAIRCLKNIFEEEGLPTWIPIRTTGLITNQAAYIGWCENELSIPSRFLYDQEKADILRDDIDLIESLQMLVYTNVQRYYDKPRNGSVSGEHEVATQCQQHFLKAAHDLLFGEMITDICTNASMADHNEKFCEDLRKTLQDTLERILRSSGNHTGAIMKQIEAEKWIWINCNKIIQERKERYAG